MVRPVDAGRVHRRSVPGRACHPLTISERRDDHRRRRPPGDGRNRHAPGRPCCRSAGSRRRLPGRRVVRGQRRRVSKAAGVDELVRSDCPRGGRGDRRLRRRPVALPAPQRRRGHRGGQGQPPSPTPGGKSDPADAVEAARAAQSGRARGLAKTGDGSVEAIRALLVTRRSARAVRTKTLCQIRHLSFAGPDVLRERLQGLSTVMLAHEAAALRPRAVGDPVLYATKLSVQASGDGSWTSTRRRIASTSLRTWWRRPHPACRHCTASASSPPPRCWWPLVTILSGSPPPR